MLKRFASWVHANPAPQPHDLTFIFQLGLHEADAPRCGNAEISQDALGHVLLGFLP